MFPPVGTERRIQCWICFWDGYRERGWIGCTWVCCNQTRHRKFGYAGFGLYVHSDQVALGVFGDYQSTVTRWSSSLDSTETPQFCWWKKASPYLSWYLFGGLVVLSVLFYLYWLLGVVVGPVVILPCFMRIIAFICEKWEIVSSVKPDFRPWQFVGKWTNYCKRRIYWNLTFTHRVLEVLIMFLIYICCYRK